MKKMTPMILVILMLTSFLSAVDVYELQEESNTEETSARSGADPEVSYVTSPRETTYSDTGNTNVLLAGEPINFKAYLKNSGDADLTNMQYSVTVYNSNNGQRGSVATDSAGNDLSWQNDKAICSNSCQNAVLAPGSYLGGGESTLLTTSGNVIEWSPRSGDYFVEVRVTSQVLGDPGNNEISFPVSAKDWHDIVVDVMWLDDNGNAVNGAIEGENPVDFKVMVTLEGSDASTMNLRTTNVSISLNSGSFSGNSIETIGVSTSVLISEDNEAVQTNATRQIIGANPTLGGGDLVGESIFTYTPPADGLFEIDVRIESYFVLDPVDCQDPVELCERMIDGANAEDEFNGNNIASIYGSAETVHDLMLDDFYILKQANPDDKEDTVGDQTYGFIGGEVTEPLSTGEHLFVATVAYASSSDTSIYDWNVTFSVTDLSDNSVQSYHGNECVDPEDYTFKYMGMSTDKTDADMFATVCMTHDFALGDYVVSAQVNMLGLYEESSETVDERMTDMIGVNNIYDYDVEVVNYNPQIISVKTNPVVAMVGTDVTVLVDTFDVEGDKLTYTFNDGSGQPLTCSDDGDESTCVVTITELMLPSLEVVVSVVDPNSIFPSIESRVVETYIVNDFTSSGLAAGFASIYSVSAKVSGLTVDFADGPTDAVSISECANSAVPVGSVVVTPSTKYGSSTLVAHTITVHYPSDLGVQHMWMGVENQVVGLVSGEGIVIDSTTSGYTHTFAGGTDSLTPGTTFYLIAEDCETPEPPAGTATLTATPTMGGDIVIAYNYESLLSTEQVVITICEDTSDCATPERVYQRADTDTRSVTYQSGTHAQTYVVSAQLCNDYACGASNSATVISDSEVASVTATNVTIVESGENWIVNWGEDYVDEDVAGWYVCHKRGEFTDSEMKVLIDNNACTMVMGAKEATIPKYTTTETVEVFFGIVPYDAVMNIAYAGSTDSILYDRAQDVTNPDDGSTTTDSDASSGVPTWTWGVIGAVVVVAFVVGAFILSRGESEDDDDKEWDY